MSRNSLRTVRSSSVENKFGQQQAIYDASDYFQTLHTDKLATDTRQFKKLSQSHWPAW